LPSDNLSPVGAGPPIIHVAAELGQGGTERSIELLATAASGPAGQRVFALDRGGATADRLIQAGIEVRLFEGDIEAAAAAIAAAGPASVLLNRAGRPEAKWNGLIRRLQGGSATLIDINHFGWLDRTAIGDGLAGVYCVSGTALAKYLRLAHGRWPTAGELAGFPIALAAGNNPVAAAPVRPAEPRAALRRRLGLPVEKRLAIRLGRPDPRKWSDLLIVHAARLATALPDLHFVFLSAPDSRRAVIQATLGERATLVPFTAIRMIIQDHLAAADVMLHYARYGESFGYALAEAAALELPAVVQATPWGDNAQLELVRHGVTGFVAGGFDDARLYLEQLLADPALAARIGGEARLHVEREFGVEATWRLLAAFIAHVRAGGRGLLAQPVTLAASQQARLAGGIANYGERFPLLTRLAAEAPLYGRPWFWRHLAGDFGAILARRVRARRGASLAALS
jgi:glycosyltransferase involved in cell wall biosynthesis